MIKKQLKIRVHPSKHKALKILAAEKGVSVNYILDLLISMVTTNPDKFFLDEKEGKK